MVVRWQADHSYPVLASHRTQWKDQEQVPKGGGHRDPSEECQEQAPKFSTGRTWKNNMGTINEAV
jgi:hypothetical protein